MLVAKIVLKVIEILMLDSEMRYLVINDTGILVPIPYSDAAFEKVFNKNSLRMNVFVKCAYIDSQQFWSALALLVCAWVIVKGE